MYRLPIQANTPHVGCNESIEPSSLHPQWFSRKQGHWEKEIRLHHSIGIFPVSLVYASWIIKYHEKSFQWYSVGDCFSYFTLLFHRSSFRILLEAEPSYRYFMHRPQGWQVKHGDCGTMMPWGSPDRVFLQTKVSHEAHEYMKCMASQGWVVHFYNSKSIMVEEYMIGQAKDTCKMWEAMETCLNNHTREVSNSLPKREPNWVRFTPTFWYIQCTTWRWYW